jgi:hypothetical protein
MQFRTTGLLLLGAIALPAPGTARIAPAPPVISTSRHFRDDCHVSKDSNSDHIARPFADKVK